MIPRLSLQKYRKSKNFLTWQTLPSVIRPDMIRAIWEKYVCNVSENQISAVLNIPFGAWGACTDADRLRVLTAGEAIQIAREKRNSHQRKLCRKTSGPSQKASPGEHSIYPQDLLAGRKTEVEMFAGTILRMGKELGIPTPFNEFLYHAIRVLEAKNEGKIPGSRGGAFS